MAFIGLFGLLFYAAILISAVYAVVTVIQSMKERNHYLREIRDELRKSNEQRGSHL